LYECLTPASLRSQSTNVEFALEGCELLSLAHFLVCSLHMLAATYAVGTPNRMVGATAIDALALVIEGQKVLRVAGEALECLSHFCFSFKFGRVALGNLCAKGLLASPRLTSWYT
jgi:hypothetical protein